MADSDALIPYQSSKEIILRQKDSIVVFDPASQQLVSRNAVSDQIDLTECPHCHRPLREEDSVPIRGRTTSSPVTATANFASPEYFRMLQSSLPSTTNVSRQSSPHKRIQSGLVSPPVVRPPPNAEFIASSPSPDAHHRISTAAFTQNYFKNFFIEEKELGRGSKGVVLLVKHVLDGVSLGHFALKRIPVGDDHKWLEKVLIEVQLLQHLSHQNLVSYRHVWLEEMQITTFGPAVPCAFILQQYCSAGDLHNYILGGVRDTTSTEQLKQRIRRRSKGAAEPIAETIGPRKLHFEEIYAFFKDIVSGLNHLHVHNYIHRDLKPNNCLLHRNGNELRVLVSDFGEVQSQDQVRQSTGATGTISYCSPEVLRIDAATGRLGNFSAKSDIFSLGMILHFLCFARLPYRNADSVNEETEDVDLLREEIISWIGPGDLTDARPDLPDKLYIFLRRLLSLDPANRPTAEEILQSIKTGTGLEEVNDRVSSQIFEDLHDEGRISRIETPPPSMSRRSSAVIPRPTRQPPPSKLRFTASQNGEGEAGFDTDSIPPESATSLVLLPRHSSPLPVTPSTSAIPLRRSAFELLNHQHLHPQTLLTTKIVFLMAKVLSLYVLCLPAAADPKVGLSLLTAALVDLLVFDMGMTLSISLLMVHMAAIGLLWKWEALCIVGFSSQSKPGSWPMENL